MSTATVIVIGGGESAEHDVSLGSSAAVEAALAEGADIEVSRLIIGRDGIWRDGDAALGDSPAASLSAAVARFADADVVFPVLHGELGEDGTLSALCDLAHVPYVGSGLAASAIAMDKYATKLVAQDAGLSVTPGRVVTLADVDDLTFEREVVVKPVSAGSSFGVTIARDQGELIAAVKHAATFGSRVLLEEPVHAREIDVAVIREGGRVWAAPPLEIHSEGIFDSVTKYDGSAKFTVPAQVSDAELDALQSSAIAMFEALGCDGVARVDFFVTDAGVLVNEINTLPGLGATSQVPRMFRAAGIEYPDLMRRLVDDKLAR